jgi:hypothetical protein
VVALASALASRPVRGDIAMTGEITLSGRVLPVGGIKEKVLAARRYGLHEVILPRQNEKNVKEDLNEELRRGLIVHYAEEMDDVLKLALVERPAGGWSSAVEPALSGVTHLVQDDRDTPENPRAIATSGEIRSPALKTSSSRVRRSRRRTTADSDGCGSAETASARHRARRPALGKQPKPTITLLIASTFTCPRPCPRRGSDCSGPARLPRPARRAPLVRHFPEVRRPTTSVGV